MLTLTEFPPSPLLRSVVQRYILTEGIVPKGHQLDHLLIPSWTEILYFNLSDDCQRFVNGVGTANDLRHAAISGQMTRAFSGHFSGHVKIIGAHFYTPAIHQLFGLPMREMANKGLLLEDLMGNQIIEFCDRLREQKSITQVIQQIEMFLIRKLRECIEPHPVLLNTLDLLPEGIMKSGIVRRLAFSNKVSVRKLEKIFAEQTGLTPKEFCRMYRFHSIIQMINANCFNWRHAVERLGYYDQAHLLNDFRLVTGYFPTGYLPQHSPVNRFITNFKPD